MSRKKEMTIYLRKCQAIKDGRWIETVEPEKVRVMARAEGYAMVRRKGCNPFVVRDYELSPNRLAAAGSEGDATAGVPVDHGGER